VAIIDRDVIPFETRNAVTRTAAIGMRRFQPFTRSPDLAGCRLSSLSTIVGRPPPPEIKVS
jgi:hypothetical protein